MDDDFFFLRQINIEKSLGHMQSLIFARREKKIHHFLIDTYDD
jgi:hypothetical protein